MMKSDVATIDSANTNTGFNCALSRSKFNAVDLHCRGFVIAAAAVAIVSV